MTSLLTNNAAMSALSQLSATQRALQTTQGQVSSGLRVAGASDNAAYWSISTAMKSQVAALSAVDDDLSLTKSIADVTATALQSVIGIVQEIQKDVVTSQQPGVDQQQVQQVISGKQDQIKSTINSASFNGVNWLVENNPYQINETLTTNILNTSTLNESFNLNGNAVAPHAETDDYGSADQENIQVTAPDGSISTFAESSDRTYTIAKSAGSSSYSLTNNVETDDPVSTLNAYVPPIAQVPTSYSTSGISLSNRSDFTIYDPGSVTTSTWNYSDAGSDASSSFVYHENYLFDHDQHITDFMKQAVQSSILSNVLGLDVTSQQSYAGANEDAVEATLSSLTAVATKVGALQNQLSTQQTFNSSLTDAITAGVGSLEDADMNLASTRLQALQTQQQLGIQSLSIANQNSQLVLKLFG